MIVIDGNKALIDMYYGHPQKNSMKTVVAIDGGVPVGVAGIMIEQGKHVLFSDFSDQLREHPSFKRTIINGFNRLLNLFPDTKVFAHANPKVEGSCDLLSHLGFEHYRGDVWIR